MARICITGAGFSGAVIARRLAEAGFKVLVIDERSHVAGNCHTERDPESGVMVHRYGPHIFHTSDAEVWAYVNRFAEMAPFVNRVKATVRGKVYSLPINLHTINQFYGTAMGPEDARRFLESRARTDIDDPQTFEDQALRFVGEELYEAFFKGYTQKQWGVSPTALPASILKRLPLRFNYDDNYFDHRWQAIPRHGYTALIDRILDAPGIEVRLGVRHEDVAERFDHLFYSGPIDRYFGWSEGRLGYRTLDFVAERGEGDMLGCAVMNHPDPATPYTRVTEHKHFAPWESGGLPSSICFREYSRLCEPGDIPYYPIRLVTEKAMLARYEAMAADTRGVTFVGRLGTYSYIDMDVTIRRAMDVADAYLVRQRVAA
ncbi:MAG: UDP-galactopyranose mutase [Paracoccaceae bacterium]|jgi:UDP-galactopyranose mutase